MITKSNWFSHEKDSFQAIQVLYGNLDKVLNLVKVGLGKVFVCKKTGIWKIRGFGLQFNSGSKAQAEMVSPAGM